MKNKEPELRLLGFDEPWEIRMLKEIFNILDGDRGKNYPGEADFHKEGHTLFLDTGNVRKNGFLFSNKKYISEEKDSSLKNGQLKLNDFVLTSRGTLGNVAFYDELVQSNYPSVRINSAMLILRPKLNDLVSNKYLEAVLRGNLIEKFINKNKVGSAQPHITKGEFSKVNIGIPASIVEQKKIGSFFKDLDDTISLHQQELEALKQTKQGFLQKMFPKDGETEPAVRFEKYTENWQLKKLGDILKVNSGRDYKHLGTGNIPVYGTGGFMLNVNESLSNEDAIGLGRKGTIDKPQLLKAPFWTVDTLFFMTMKKDIDLHFCYSLINMISWKKYDESTGVPSLSKTNIDKILVKVPSYEEQLKIGEFFRQLDEVIELKEKELEALKETKRGFLQKMFV